MQGIYCYWASMETRYTLLWASLCIFSTFYRHPQNLAPFKSEAHSVVLIRVPQEEVHILVKAPQES